MRYEFKHLFTPMQIGPITVRNRIFSPPHGTYFADLDGIPNERMAYYHAARARGGVGLIITEGVAIHPTGRPFATTILGYDKRSIPGFRLIASMVHEHGSKIFGQLYHRGRQMESLHTRLPLWAPSPIPSPSNRETPQEMEREEMEEIIQGFARGAAHYAAAGFDGVEIHAAHGYLLTQFMSPLSNQRQDEYGGSLENRLRFPLQVLQAAREAVGRQAALGIRISGDELVQGGLTLDDMREIAPILEATGLLDYISVSLGNYSTHYLMIGDMSVPLGVAVYMAAGIKETVRLPVFTALRIKDPVQAENILAEGHADMVGMCRALITDPELPLKAQEGRLEEIRYCISCNQECRTHFLGRMISCVQNPVVGFEKELGRLPPATRSKRIMVIGGGPAGMEAARVAALRGHQVTLYEKKAELGGQVRMASKIPTRDEFGDVARYLVREIRRLGVEVVPGTEVQPEMVLSINPDALVVATGSEPFPAAIPGADLKHVVHVWDVLNEEAELGNQVLIVDGGESFWPCCGTADFLLERGKKVEIVTHLYYVGVGIPAQSLPPLYQRLLRKGAVLTPSHTVKEIRKDSVIVSNVHTHKTRVIGDVDSVVLATGTRACGGIYKALKGRVNEIYAVGDCVAPRKVHDAIREGFWVGRLL